jgi:hypothetical protein
MAFLAGTVATALAEEASPRWSITESENFRFLARGKAPKADVVEGCERLREQLIGYWLEDSAPTAWRPKCDLVLHTTDASYLAEVGAQGSATVGSSIWDHRDGKIISRRIDIRAKRANWQTSAFPHELTHIVIAGHFAGRPLPPWADEGMAILADPHDKQLRHRADLTNALAQRQAFRLVELLNLQDYPPAPRWGAFYGQSASLVQFLLEQKTPREFLRFIELCDTSGPAQALQTVYQIESISAAESAWRKNAKSPRSPLFR